MTSTAPGRFRLEKHRWIAELVPNRTFADVGGLGGTVNIERREVPRVGP